MRALGGIEKGKEKENVIITKREEKERGTAVREVASPILVVGARHPPPLGETEVSVVRHLPPRVCSAPGRAGLVRRVRGVHRDRDRTRNEKKKGGSPLFVGRACRVKGSTRTEVARELTRPHIWRWVRSGRDTGCRAMLWPRARPKEASGLVSQAARMRSS